MFLSGKSLSRISLGLSQLNNNLYNKKKFIDTSSMYGDTEKILGKLSKQKKNKIIVSTKAGFTGGKKRNFKQKFLKNEIIKTLKRIKKDSIDIFFLNKPTLEEIKKNHLIDFMHKMIKTGLINYGGIIVGNERLPKYIYNSKHLKCFSFLYNLINVQNKDDIIYSKKQKKINFIRSPFNSGLLTNNFKNNLKFSNQDFRYQYFSGYNYKLKLRKIMYIKNKFKFQNSILGDMAYKFVLSNESVDSCFFGCSKKSQIKQLINLKSKSFFSTKKLKYIEKEIEKINLKLITHDQK